jgi:hypothetical protein
MMPGEYPPEFLDSAGMPRGMSAEEWGDDGKPKKAAKAAKKAPAKKKG